MTITYGMSIPSIADSLFGDKEDMTDDEKIKQATKIHDSLMKGFPAIARAIANAQSMAAQLGYTETILGRRRHHPNMQLPKFEFVPMPGYVNPDIDPLDPESLKNKEQIPKRIVDALTKEFNSYKYYGKIVKRTKELAEQKIKVINNSYKIEEASRQVFNCVTKDTEILTLGGWKKYNEVSVGDKILSYSLDTDEIETDEILAVHIYDEPTKVIGFKNNNIDVLSTENHRWVIYNPESQQSSFHTTEEIVSKEVSDRCALLTTFDYNLTVGSTVYLEHLYDLSTYETIAEDGVWCVTTNNQTWICRRNGSVVISGNSIIQGSAAELTKMAMLRLEHDQEWQDIGGRFIIPVHDELICEVPIENAEKGAEVLARCMCEAGDFLPFSLTCDVETTLRWYGLGIEDIFSREKPESLDWDSLSESNIEWVQCMLIENEYLLPVFKNEDGSKPSGVRAQGVNGKVTDEMLEAIEHYKARYGIDSDKAFIDHIEAKTVRGVY